jgi:hypothetical protein
LFRKIPNTQQILKRFCRQYGIKRWPYRKVNSLNKKKESLEQAAQGVYEQYLKLQEQINELENEKKGILLEETGWTKLSDEDGVHSEDSNDAEKKSSPLTSTKPIEYPTISPRYKTEIPQHAPNYTTSSEKLSIPQITIPPISCLLNVVPCSIGDDIPLPRFCESNSDLLKFTRDLMICLTTGDGVIVWFSDALQVQQPEVFSKVYLGTKYFKNNAVVSSRFENTFANIFHSQYRVIDMQITVPNKNLMCVWHVRGIRLEPEGYIWNCFFEREYESCTNELIDVVNVVCS